MTDADRLHKHIGALEELAEFAGTVGRAHLELAMAELHAGKCKDPAGAARNAAVVAGVALDKRQKLLEEAPAHIANRSPEQTVNALARKLGITIDSTAEEIPERRRIEAANGASSS